MAEDKKKKLDDPTEGPAIGAFYPYKSKKMYLSPYFEIPRTISKAEEDYQKWGRKYAPITQRPVSGIDFYRYRKRKNRFNLSPIKKVNDVVKAINSYNNDVKEWNKYRSSKMGKSSVTGNETKGVIIGSGKELKKGKSSATENETKGVTIGSGNELKKELPKKLPHHQKIPSKMSDEPASLPPQTPPPISSSPPLSSSSSSEELHSMEGGGFSSPILSWAETFFNT